MKKNLTKLFSILMMMVFVMSMVACGSKSTTAGSEKSNLEKLSVDELMDKMTEAAKDVEGITFKGNIGAILSVSDQKMEGSVKFEAKTNIKETTDGYVKADVSINALGQKQDMTVEMYEVMNENTMETYVKLFDNWVYESVDLTESEDEIDMDKLTDALKSIDFSALNEYFDKVEVKTSGNNYNLVYEVTSAKLIEKIENSIFASSLEDTDTSKIPDIKISFTLSVDGKTFLPKSMKLDIDMNSFEVEGMEIKLTDFVFEVEYEAFDSVEITIPDEALEAKENGNDSDSAFVDLFR